jgi:hypothetical protein
MEFIKAGEKFINMSLVKYVEITTDGLDVFVQDDIIPVTGDAAKYLREVLEGAQVASVAEINRKMPVQGQNK